MKSVPGSGSQSKSSIWLAAGAGCIFLVAGSLCCLAAAIFIPNRNPVNPGERLGTFVVAANGGSFQNGQVSIEVTPGSTHNELKLTVSSDPTASAYLEEGMEMGPAYRITGPIQELDGELKISIALSPEQLAAAGEQGGLILEETGYATSYGEVQHAQPLSTTIDANSRTATTTLHLAGARGVGVLPKTAGALAGVLVSTGLQDSEDSNGAITVRFVPGLIYDAYESQHFRMNYLSKLHDTQLARQAVDILEDQYQKIVDHGFDFKDIERIEVTVKYLDHRTGQFVSSVRGNSYCSLELDSQFFKDAAFFAANRSDLTRTIGHELLHLAQFTLDPRYALIKAKNPSPVLWIDEAIATWFESQSVADPAYVAQNAARNNNFIHTPLLTPPSAYEAAQDHGYGASFFIQYLARQYTDFFPAEIYAEIAAGAADASQALIQALERHDTDLDAEWPSFLQAYYSAPQQFNSGGPAVQLMKLKAEAMVSGDDYQTMFAPENSLKPNWKSAQDGVLLTGAPATVQLSFTQPALTADGIYLGIDSSPDSQFAYQSPGAVTIAADGPADAGVLVLALPLNSDTWVPVAGAPFDYLSPHGSSGQGGYQVMIDGFGAPGSNSTYRRLLLIPLNHSSISNDPGQSASITIQLSYWTHFTAPPESGGQDEWPAETPSIGPSQVPPPPESSHACADVSLSDLKKPLGHTSKCWLTCFGIGSGSHSDAEIQSCIDRNQ